MKIFKREKEAVKTATPVDELIEEQREKESVKMFRRGFCIRQAAMVMSDECTPQQLIAMAEEIYKYVYGDDLSEF